MPGEDKTSHQIRKNHYALAKFDRGRANKPASRLSHPILVATVGVSSLAFLRPPAPHHQQPQCQLAGRGLRQLRRRLPRRRSQDPANRYGLHPLLYSGSATPGTAVRLSPGMVKQLLLALPRPGSGDQQCLLELRQAVAVHKGRLHPTVQHHVGQGLDTQGQEIRRQGGQSCTDTSRAGNTDTSRAGNPATKPACPCRYLNQYPCPHSMRTSLPYVVNSGTQTAAPLLQASIASTHLGGGEGAGGGKTDEQWRRRHMSCTRVSADVYDGGYGV